MNNRSDTKPRWMWSSALVWTVIGCIVAVSAISAVRWLRNTNDIRSRKARMALTLLALQNFYDSNGKLPDTTTTNDKGEPLYSWRFALVSFLDAAPPGADFVKSKSWMAPEHLAWRTYSQSCLSAPGDTHTVISTIVGEGSTFSIQTDNQSESRGWRLLLLECERISNHWMAPWDVAISDIMACRGHTVGECVGSAGGVVVIGFANRNVLVLKDSCPVECLFPFLPNGESNPTDIDKLSEYSVVVEG